jgi:hypothetical protein
MSEQWNERTLLSNKGGCHPNQARNTGGCCCDFASASAMALCLLLITIDHISTGFFSGKAVA